MDSIDEKRAFVVAHGIGTTESLTRGTDTGRFEKEKNQSNNAISLPYQIVLQKAVVEHGCSGVCKVLGDWPGLKGMAFTPPQPRLLCPFLLVHPSTCHLTSDSSIVC